MERFSGGTGNEARFPWGSTGNFMGISWDLPSMNRYEWDLMNRRLYNGIA